MSWLGDLLHRRPQKPAARDLIQADYDELLRRRVGPLPWCIDEVAWIDEQLCVTGWAIPPAGDPSRTDIQLAYGRLVSLVGSLHRPDVAHCFWYLPGAEWSGFRAAFDMDDVRPDRLSVAFADRASGAVIEPW